VKLVSYRTVQNGPWLAGVQIDDSVVEARVAATVAGLADEVAMGLTTTRAMLALDTEQLQALATGAGQVDSDIAAIDEVQIGPPVPDPQKIICLGLNYRDHADEAGLDAPDAPMFFAKYPNSLVGPRADIVPPTTTNKVDYEAELAVVIGRPGRSIAEADALSHVGGVMALNDVSARDLQLANNLWTGGKAIDTFAPCGPALVTLDEIEDVQTLALRTRVNGETVQEGTTASMIFGVAATIAFLSQIMTLEIGDIIATGTPAGVGQSRTPPLFLHGGDIVEVELDQVGTLRNTVVDARA
jgi:2-keto-4-pentenoate hydratase/2-oxohepta-3-ene-1,7-dioic acid hydratase in catechol pathway